MIKRCYNPKSRSYQYYGAKGISVCESWKTSFKAFYQDMGPRPSANYSIDRVDPDGNYEPANCRWLTKSENSTRVRFAPGLLIKLTFNGKTQSIRAWSKELGLGYQATLARYHAGLPVERVLAKQIGLLLTYDDKTQSVNA